MRYIAHRGNTQGPDKNENQPFYIEGALRGGFDVEIDIRYCDGMYFLGHDTAEHQITFEQIESWIEKYPEREIYVHCKNVDALDHFSTWVSDNIIPFFHDIDEAIILPNKKIWVHPRAVYNHVNSVADRSNFIYVDPKLKNIIQYGAYGICSDYVGFIQ